jgi:hypothetical protein
VLSNNASGQKLYLKMIGVSEKENTLIDSIGYNRLHNTVKSIFEEGNLLTAKLTQIGYIENQILENKRPNDSLFQFQFNIGKKIDFIHIYIGANSALQRLPAFNSKRDTITIPFAGTSTFLNENLKHLERDGYALAKLQLINFTKINRSLFAELIIDTGKKRHLNSIIIKGYDKFSEGHKRNILRFYKNKVFNQDNLKKIHDDFDKLRFVNQSKYPEILFTKDTTKVYVYLQKAKPNKFDGLIGFSNDEKSKLALNGYLDLLLVNTINSGESFSLYWKSDGNKQKTFNASLELPYVFKSRFGLKTSLTIFKQDSTFQNTKTAIAVGYFFNYNTRLYLGRQSTESSDIQKTNNSSISDFNNTFTTLNFEFLDFKTLNYLFPENTKIDFKVGIGSRNTKLNINQQFLFELNVKHNLYFNEKNSINIKSQNYYLQSDSYIFNELYRFGGINSIRGFNENSLQSNYFTSLLLEYRYILAPSLYVHTITDYGYYQDKTTNNKGSLLGIGFGFGVLTKNGLLNLVYANGSTNTQSIALSNAIVHLSFKTNF